MKTMAYDYKRGVKILKGSNSKFLDFFFNFRQTPMENKWATLIKYHESNEGNALRWWKRW